MLGVLLQPGSGRLYVGLPGYGSFLIAHGQSRELRVSARAKIQEMPVVPDPATSNSVHGRDC